MPVPDYLKPYPKPLTIAKEQQKTMIDALLTQGWAKVESIWVCPNTGNTRGYERIRQIQVRMITRRSVRSRLDVQKTDGTAMILLIAQQ